MKQKLFRLFADLRFAIVTLLIIGGCSIIGTIIEQDQSIEIYKINYPMNKKIFGILSWDIIIKFGFDHIYKTWWFLILILIFGISLSTCTFLQQFPVLKISRRCQFFRKLDQFNRLKISTAIKNFSLTKILRRLKNRKYSIFQQKNIFYCYKGLLGRIAPILVHFSMILILSGTITGAFFGFKAQEIIPKTETFHIQNILNSGQFTIIPNVSIRINDFWITYTKKKTISQFYSDISILNIDGKEIKRKTSFVNSPLIYKNIYYYQTDWELIGLRLGTLNNQIFEYPLVNIATNQNKIWLTWVPETTKLDDGIILIIDNLQGYCSIYNNFGKFLGNIEVNELLNLNTPFAFFEILSSTGLQIKTDPGIPIIYIGFLFLMLSTLASYVTYSQIWIIKTNQQVFVGGNTNRATFEFELEFFKLIQKKIT